MGSHFSEIKGHSGEFLPWRCMLLGSRRRARGGGGGAAVVFFLHTHTRPGAGGGGYDPRLANCKAPPALLPPLKLPPL